ncbi:cyclase family protein [Metabacillus litoralis]|uniref:cyclase family protein n=1 Tax=Metabacillus TaxID=2675233 RepID=UPI001B917837|nr:cyclase family protein [Metabacillus litoralis]UHA61250.1 cyclase family protein [Metabacillus litoralis]
MNMKKVVDLSISITEQTPIYPGDPEPSLQPAATVERDGYNVSLLKIGSHTGTHVDAPYHFHNDGQKIDEVPLQQFMGRGILFDVTGKNKKEAITLEDMMEKLPHCQEGDIALFHTGWSKYLGQPAYYEHPYLKPEVIEELLSRGIKTFFIDALNIDPPDGSSFEGHDLITKVNGIIGENFTNFDLIDFPNPFIIALPLKLKGIDGSPVRAIAIEMEE